MDDEEFKYVPGEVLSCCACGKPIRDVPEENVFYDTDLAPRDGTGLCFDCAEEDDEDEVV